MAVTPEMVGGLFAASALFTPARANTAARKNTVKVSLLNLINIKSISPFSLELPTSTIEGASPCLQKKTLVP
jgi:hypothetical protein